MQQPERPLPSPPSASPASPPPPAPPPSPASPVAPPHAPAPLTQEYAARVPAPVEQVLFEVRRFIVGQDRMLERLLVALLAGGHVLLEGVPGIAKTAAVRALATAVGGSFGRIQFTPDLVPADLVGTRIYNPHQAAFSTELGPVFCNLLLADEVNRAPAKVQSALLQVMQEHQVTIGKETHPVADPFLVLATQNPIEADGTYPLPEAQIDRFMLKVLVGYPSFAEEVVVVQRMVGPDIELRQVISTDQLLDMQRAVRSSYVDPAVIAYAATLTTATRNPANMGLPEFAGAIAYGASPRASIHLVAAARALAFIRGRSYVLGHDVADVAPEVLRHRLVLSYDGIADGVHPDLILGRLLERYPLPRIDLAERHVS
jgi:MoxR-like ATPase